MSAVLERIEAARLGPWLLVGVVALLCVAALGIGQFPIGPVQIIEVLASRLLGWPSEVPDTIVTVILQVRLPRIAAALVVGAALAAAGAAYQGLFRNPLVSPTSSACRPGRGSAPCSAFFCRYP
jgi:iron complex transport system permease protein